MPAGSEMVPIKAREVRKGLRAEHLETKERVEVLKIFNPQKKGFVVWYKSSHDGEQTLTLHEFVMRGYHRPARKF